MNAPYIQHKIMMLHTVTHNIIYMDIIIMLHTSTKMRTVHGYKRLNSP